MKGIRGIILRLRELMLVNLVLPVTFSINSNFLPFFDAGVVAFVFRCSWFFVKILWPDVILPIEKCGNETDQTEKARAIFFSHAKDGVESDMLSDTPDVCYDYVSTKIMR